MRKCANYANVLTILIDEYANRYLKECDAMDDAVNASGAGSKKSSSSAKELC